MGINAASITVCFTLWGFHPSSHVPEETVDLIEINHFHDDQGLLIFDQILFYDWSESHGRYQVRDWRLLKSPNQIPLPSARDREYVSVWNDFKTHDTLRTTKSKTIRETWTQYDPEQTEREFLPESKRRKLNDLSAQHKRMSTSAAPNPAGTTGPSSTNPRTPTPLRPLQNPTRTRYE